MRGGGEGVRGGERERGGREQSRSLKFGPLSRRTHILPTFSVSRSKSLATCSAHCISFFDSGG